MTNHIKTKHNVNDPIYRRGRGRPRKNVSITLIAKPVAAQPSEKDAQKFKNFFDSEEIRRKKDTETYDILEVTANALAHLHSNYDGKIFINYPNSLDHPLYKALVLVSERKKNDPEVVNTPEGKFADEIFAIYLQDVFERTNKSYYDFIVKFVALFRECINGLKGAGKTEPEFTATNSAETVPDTCNDFITEFMDQHGYFGLNTVELIEIIQHFSNWLYENKFTVSRLTLLS